MTQFIYPFAFDEDATNQIKGKLELEEPLPYFNKSQGSGFYRPGRIVLESGGELELVLYHNDATSAFMYVRKCQMDPYSLEFIGLSGDEISKLNIISLPGQLCLGADRARLIGTAIKSIFSSLTKNGLNL